MSDGTTIPEGGKLLTLDQIRGRSRKAVRCPQTSERLGEEFYVIIRPMRRAVWIASAPAPFVGSEHWPEDPRERAKCEAAAMKELSPVERQERERKGLDLAVRVLEAGLVEPKFSDELAELIGDDVDLVAFEIMRYSGMVVPTAAPPATASEAPPA